MPKEVQITETQFEIWLDAAPTKALLAALAVELEDQIDQGGDGSLVDSSNADLTHALVHGCMGRQDMIRRLINLEGFLDYHGKIFYSPESAIDASK